MNTSCGWHCQGNLNPTARPQRIEAIDEKVDENGGHLTAINIREHGLVWSRDADLDSLKTCTGTSQIDSLRYDLTQIRQAAARGGWSRKIKEFLDRVFQAQELSMDYLQVFLAQRPPWRTKSALDQHLYRRERITNLMGYAGGQLADRSELFGPEQLALLLLGTFGHLLDTLKHMLNL